MTASPNSGLALSLVASALLSDEDSRKYTAVARQQRKPLITFLVENRILASAALAAARVPTLRSANPELAR